MTDSAPVRAVRRVLCDWRYFPYLATAILVCDAIANIILIRVAPSLPSSHIPSTHNNTHTHNSQLPECPPVQPDTEWETYMAHGAAFLRGERDYAVLRGDSARAVGPAGYVYLCAALHRLTAGGAHLVRAQALWAVLYSATQALAFALLARTRIAPPWAALVLAASRQLHRLYVLRLGDDCWATLLALGAAVLLAHDRWAAGTALYCAAAGVSLAVLHYLPGLVCLLVQRRGLARAAACLAAACAAQLVAAAPFLAAQPAHYLGAVFDVARRLPHVLSVNWRFVPPSLVLSRGFAAALNACHAFLLAYLAVRRWWPRVRPTSFFADYGRPIPPQGLLSLSLPLPSLSPLCSLLSAHPPFLVPTHTHTQTW